MARNQEAFEKQVGRLKTLVVNIGKYPLISIKAISKTLARPVPEYGTVCLPNFATWANKIEHIYYEGLFLIGIDRKISRDRLNALTEGLRYMSRLKNLRFRFGQTP